MKILLELRPALDGHAGIPQETRLLFRGLDQLDGVQVDGLLQSSTQLLGKGLPAEPAVAGRWSEDRKINRLSRVVVSLHPGDPGHILRRLIRLGKLGASCCRMLLAAVMGLRESLTCFEPGRFEDFLWRALFSKTLPPADFPAVTSLRYRIARVPWSAAHAAALATRKLGASIYPRLDTRDYDVMIAETPYPGRVSPGTRLVVRYHDAIPILMPHTISDRAYHQASHYQALRRNVLDGAWFACVSDASRQDLIAIFPEAAPRAVTIPNIVLGDYRREDLGAERIPDILRTRANRTIEAKAAAHRRVDRLSGASEAQPADVPDYLLMVSTLEPRKNHLGLLAAWERLRATGHARLRLVLVGMMGWDHDAIVSKLLPFVGEGQVHVLEDVPTVDLRLLYRHAKATICPSFGEGFGFSGVEAMRCGGVVAASDLAVHREIYGNAAEYFNPYSPGDMSQVIERLISADGAARRAELLARGEVVASRYLPDQVLPQWRTFLEGLDHQAG